MSCNTQGFEYEDGVIAALNEAGCAGVITKGAGSSSVGADADFVVGGERYLVEVKKDAGAQMGGTSVRYCDGVFEMASSAVEQDTFDMIVEALKPRREDIDRFLDFVGGQRFPVSCTKDAWETAKVAGLLKPINAKIRKDTEFIVNHYKEKNIHYMQIGGAGLFYLDRNPANLPVPKLQGEIDIELRAGRSGSKVNSAGVPMVGGLLRAQGRLRFSGLSNFTLDNPESVRNLLINNKR
tara:strand:- start:737 stop:1450 length:714 start_codon:yes stop_codon:yes gene_type:complete